jgi:predicted transcriptional regulator
MTRTVRVTCTVPSDVLKAADRVAGRLDRSRSWVVTEAVRRLVAEPEAIAGASPAAAAPQGLRRAFRAAEQARLTSDLALTPAERVRISEEIARIAPATRRRPQRGRVLQFDTYEDYLDWKRFAGLEA